MELFARALEIQTLGSAGIDPSSPEAKPFLGRASPPSVFSVPLLPPTIEAATLVLRGGMDAMACLWAGLESATRTYGKRIRHSNGAPGTAWLAKSDLVAYVTSDQCLANPT